MNEPQRVLIWGKTYPELSTTYNETVCTGGCLANGRPVRVYPVPLRYLDHKQQYKLYHWADMELAPNPQDTRPESLRLASEQVTLGDRLVTDDGWAARRDVIFADPSWHYDCLEDLKAEQEQRGTSLGFVPVGAVERVWVKWRTPEEEQKHHEKLSMLQGRIDLFDPTPVKDLEFQPFRVHVRWRCKRLDTCPGHTAGILDWGLGELGRKKGPEKAQQKVESLADPNEYELAFFMGNFKIHPKNFGIVGLWYPKRRHVDQWKAKQAQGNLFA